MSTVISRFAPRWSSKAQSTSAIAEQADSSGPTWRLTGPTGAPVVLVLGGISASHHTHATAEAEQAGWWEEFIRPGGAVDPERFRILGIDWVVEPGVGAGTGLQALAIARVLREAKVDRLHAIVGSSFGGMVALAFAAAFPSLVERLVIIAAAHETHPMATANRVIQRRIVRLGLEDGDPQAGVALARALAMTTYRSIEEFSDRFEVAPSAGHDGPRFAVEDYLDHGASRFAAKWSAERYLALSEAIDTHRVDPAAVTVPTTLVAIDSDTLVPAWLVGRLAEGLKGRAACHTVGSLYGHDGFLKERATIEPIVGAALVSEVSNAR